MRRSLPLAMAWKIARRDLHLRFRGLRLLLVCLFLGTAALTAIISLTDAIDHELSAQGQQILGGDIQLALWQRPAAPAELEAMRAMGTVSGGTRLQAMARHQNNAAPVELKSVDSKWPLYGQFTLTGEKVAHAPEGDAAWLSPDAMARLGLQTGDRFQIGTLSLIAAGVIGTEPDRLGEGFQLGPTIIVAEDLPARAGLLQPGAMYRSVYRIALPPSADISRAGENFRQQFPNAGYELRTRDRASPGADRFVSRMGEFLLLVGLSALVIAGIGIGGGVTSYLDSRRRNIATLKILGATSGDIARIYAMQIGVTALTGSVAGILAGVVTTPFLAQFLEGLLPVNAQLRLSVPAVILALSYGILVAFIFSILPLMRAKQVPALAMMRPAGGSSVKIAPAGWGMMGAGLAAICALVLLTSSQPWLAAGFLGGSAAVLALLGLIGRGVITMARRLPRPSNPMIRNAVTNLYRPANTTAALVTAIGFGLMSFVLLAGVQTAIDGNIEKRVPSQAPDYFVLDIPRDLLPDFERIVTEQQSGARIRAVPTLRGAVLAFGPRDNLTRVADMQEVPEGAWALRGERGLTYASDVPPGNTITQGSWWPDPYTGPPLVSVDEEFASTLDLKIGDQITIGLLGVERTATIANLRQIDWESMGFNHALVFSPNALMDAPHNLAATIHLPAPANPESKNNQDSGPLLRELISAFPSSSVIETGPLLQQARSIVSQVGLATFAAASVAVLAGIAVLIGAILAARAARSYDTVILRVLGADSRQILLMNMTEYLLLAAILAAITLPLGTLLAWLVVTQMFEFTWLPDWTAIAGILGAAIILILLCALVSIWPVLRARPAQALRAL